MFQNSFPTFQHIWRRISNTNLHLPTRYKLGGRWWVKEPDSLRQECLLRLLAVAHDEQVDALPLVHGLAMEGQGVPRYRLMRLTKRLRNGTPLVSALEQTPEAVCEMDAVAIRLGYQSGTLPHIYSQLIRNHTQSIHQRALQPTNAAAWIFWGILIIVTALLVTGLILSPARVEMYGNFGVNSNNTPWNQVVPALGISQFQLLTIACASLITILYLLWLLDVLPLRHIERWIKRLTQLFKSGKRHTDRNLASLQQLLAITELAGRPVSGAISTLARYHQDPHLRHQLLFARNEMEQGNDTWRSLADAQLINDQEYQALALTESTAIRAWQLQRFADHRLEQLHESQLRDRKVLQTLAIFFMGAIVLSVAYYGFNTLLVLM